MRESDFACRWSADDGSPEQVEAVMRLTCGMAQTYQEIRVPTCYPILWYQVVSSRIQPCPAL
jgi:hypothetical protein